MITTVTTEDGKSNVSVQFMCYENEAATILAAIKLVVKEKTR